MSLKHLELTPAVADYVLAHSVVNEPDYMRRLREETMALPQNSMLSSPDQARLTAMLIRLLGARRTLEIGVFTGYSALNVALALPEEGVVIACDTSEEWTSIARRYWREAGVEQKIDLRLAPAVQTLDALLAEGRAGQFDFAFIDADKANYQNYYDRCLQLLRRGGVIAVDNVLWSGKVADPSVTDEDTAAIRSFNERIKNDERVHIAMLTISDGVTLAMKK